MYEQLNWRDRKELEGLSQEVRAEVVKRGDKAPKHKPEMAALVAKQIGCTVKAVSKDPLECYRRAIESMKDDRLRQGATPGNLINRFSKGPLQFRKHYGLVSERVAGMPRQISVGGW